MHTIRFSYLDAVKCNDEARTDHECSRDDDDVTLLDSSDADAPRGVYPTADDDADDRSVGTGHQRLTQPGRERPGRAGRCRGHDRGEARPGAGGGMPAELEANARAAGKIRLTSEAGTE